MDPILSVALILALPFGMAAFLFLSKRLLSENTVGAISIIVTGAVLGLSVDLLLSFLNTAPLVSSFQWFTLLNQTSFDVGIYLNNIALIMLVIVSAISLLVQIFSLEYMKGDKGFSRYYSYLFFFTFSMLGIVIADNLLMLFIFWELVGFSSYLLIGFWFNRDAAAQASRKAFLVNRIGDAGFLIGILIIWSFFHSLSFETLQTINFKSFPDQGLLFLAGIGLFAGCVGKSAQFPLQIWLPDAMEGPTPASALIHAATMVAAGIFLLARVFFLLVPDVLLVIAFIGAITAFMGAFAAVTQNDIKKLLAFSTISQLGYMVMGMGIGAYEASLFHLITHAFFKAGLFLCAGAVIHALHHAIPHLGSEHIDYQDMRIMGGLRRKIPLTFIAYCITAASLVGLPLFSGFLSKDAIILQSFIWASRSFDTLGLWTFTVPILALTTVMFTGFYMAKQIVLVFLGDSRLNNRYPTIDSSAIHFEKQSILLSLPLVVLSLFSLFIPFSLNPFSADNSFILDSIEKDLLALPFEPKVFTEGGHLHFLAIILSLLLAIGGMFLAVIRYKNNVLNFKEVHESGSLTAFSHRNWYLDQFYEKTVLKLVSIICKTVSKIDEKIIDRFLHFLGYFTVITSLVIAFFDKVVVDGLVNFSVFVTGKTGVLARTFQGGKVQYYFIIAILSLFALIYFTIY